MRFNSPLRYPGGKGKLSNFFKLLLRSNRLLDSHYIEPYAGGAGIALELLFEEYVTHIHINDLNRSIYAFWYSVLNRTEELCQKIEDTPVTIKEWNKQKAIQAKSKTVNLLELGFSTFFLNRTNRSGIIKGGIIGGKEQDGKWKLDVRFNKMDLIKRIEKIARYKNRISIHNKDAFAFLDLVLPRIPKKSLIYFDPPYYNKGSDLYENFYGHDDHLEISKKIKRMKLFWVVSYDNTPQIQQFYEGCNKII